MYRGLLPSQFVQIWRRVYTVDGIGGSISDYVLFIDRYWCRLWRKPIERNRTDQANVEEVEFGLLGNGIEIIEGDKVIDARERQFIVTRVWDDGAERGKRHMEARLRLIAP